MGIQHSREEKLAAFGRLLDVMDRLRSECPWDREQTTESLRTNTIEEVYELSDAILSGAPEEIKKELGMYSSMSSSIARSERNRDPSMSPMSPMLCVTS